MHCVNNDNIYIYNIILCKYAYIIMYIHVSIRYHNVSYCLFISKASVWLRSLIAEP